MADGDRLVDDHGKPDPFGIGTVTVDATGAILLDDVGVVYLSMTGRDGVENAYGLTLAGRVNKRRNRSEVLYLLDTDGVAAIISELLGMVGRRDPALVDLLLERISQLPKPSTNRGDLG